MSLVVHFEKNTKSKIQDKKNKFTSIKVLLDHILITGLSKGASDIHFEPYLTELRIRYRIDGILQRAMHIDPDLATPLTVRLKIMAQLDIAEKRLPQDGQIIFPYQNKKYVIRISTISLQNGERIALRILDPDPVHTNIAQLGLCERDLLYYKQALTQPQGLILVCGPTGSGKTMTLYSGLNYIDRDQKNICCIEDPIEIPTSGINQCEINAQADLTFQCFLRAFLRQDPDVIMIGEIRDAETAKTAIEAAHTGHLVLSTLHTNSSLEAVLRLNQMGISSDLLASALKLIISQRLIRLLCPHCKIRMQNPETAFYQGSPIITHYRANVCDNCKEGYQGRTGIYEFFIMSSLISQYLFSTHLISLNEIEQIAQKEGMLSLHHSAIELVKKGLTSFSELNRVLGTRYIKQ